MNNLITIENTEMQIREYNGQRVVTFKDIDTVHERPNGTARNAFNRNKKHFQENKHYYLIKPCKNNEEQSNVRLAYNGNIPSKGITLITERGYLMIVKAFTDDLSWKVQDSLVESYFRVKEEIAPLKKITDFPDYPKQIYQTSSTPVPKNPSWYYRNRRRMNMICEKANAPLSTLYHHILLRLGEEYDLDKANEIYEEENGHAPKYALDIVSYFPELGRMADEFLDRLENIIK